jgi:peptidoglycan/xylan/chitin deacetylase (PgdA/CDA1 family)
VFSLRNINGESLPDKTLCFTFDDGPGETEGDGPGPKTLRIARYLNEHHIEATFFAVGKFIEQYPSIISETAKLGHIVGNHTYSHPQMVVLFNERADILTEIKKTDNLIAGTIKNKNVFFRAPYGQWSEELAIHINENLHTSFNHFGPFGWDIEDGDWDFWLKGKGEEECAGFYLSKITEKRRGIILMHDSTADIEIAKQNNRTYEVVRILVPQLKNMGYSFIRLDKIPALS